MRQDGLAEQLFLIFRGSPAAIDDELHPIDGRVPRGPAQGIEERRVEPADGRNPVIKDGRAVGNDAVGLTGQAADVWTDFDGRRGNSSRWLPQLETEDRDDRRGDDERSGDQDRVNSTGRFSF